MHCTNLILSFEPHSFIFHIVGRHHRCSEPKQKKEEKIIAQENGNTSCCNSQWKARESEKEYEKT